MKLFSKDKQTAAQALTPQETALPAKVDPAPVPHREIGPAIGTGNEAQVDRRNMIADAVDEARAAEGLEIDPGEPVVKKADPKVEAAPEAEEPEAQDDAGNEPEKVEPVVAKPEPRKFKLKVNGAEREVTEEELIATAQKVASADEYLRASVEASKVALKAGLPVQDAPAEKPKDFRAVARAIQMGTEDEAAEAVRQLLEVKPSVTPDVSQVVDQRIALRDEKAKFDAEYADVLSDADLRALVFLKDEQLCKTNPELTNSERWRKAGDEVRATVKRLAPTPEVTQSDKAARKAEVAPVPSAAGRPAPKQDDEASDDPATVIAKIAAARGQGRSIQH